MSEKNFQIIQETVNLFQKDSTMFFKDILGIDTLELYQENIISAVDLNDRIAIAACHDVGKSFLMARLALAFLSLNKNSKVITTAPTYNQVQRILWSEIRSAYNKSKIPLGGTMNQTEWTIAPDWFAIGFTPKNELTNDQGQGTQSNFQGFHADKLLVIFDEATGIPPNIWTMAEGLLTSANVKFVAIGNPTSKNSEFYNCFKSKSWTKIKINCFDSPNLKANNILNVQDIEREIQKIKSMSDNDAKEYLNAYKIIRPYLLTAKWVIENSMKWGIEHPLTVSKILGDFPEINDNSLVSLGMVERAQLRECKTSSSDRKTIGVDVARFGADSTVLTAMHGLKQLSRKEMRKLDALEVSGEVINLSREIGGADIIVIDETGVGGGVVDLLRDASNKAILPRSCDVRGVHFGAACEGDSEKEKYVNVKARMFDLLREDLKNDEQGLSLLNESIYLEELPSIIYRFDQKGRMYIESKDEFKKRTGRKSPDSADSLALANYGRYDEIGVGNLTNEFLDSGMTLISSLNDSRGW